MAPTEMVQHHPPLSLPVSNTPPESPGLHPVAVMDDEQLTDMATATAAMKTIPTNPPPSLTTPCSSFVEVAEQFMEALKSICAKREPLPPVKLVKASCEDTVEEPKARASTPEFKQVNEVWDKKEYKYKFVESLTPADELNELDHFIFVVRTRIGAKDPIQYIDINSSGLRDILREVLQDVQGICLHEEKPSVEQSLLHHFLSDLEDYRKDPSSILDRSTLERLDLLLNYIQTTYASSTESLGLLLEKGQITYDLLCTLFKPNALAYTRCFGTGQSRCVKYEFGEERTARGGVKYFHIRARYPDFDGKAFGVASSEHAIEKFRGARQIAALEVFPLNYHPVEKHMRAHLTKCGEKFLSMMDIHLCEYEGAAFYIEKEQVVEIFIKSRVMVDAAYFREENSNYSRPAIKESSKGSSGWIIIDLDEVTKESSSPTKDHGM